MTTIAYEHKNKQIAFDSRQTRDNIIISDSCDKFACIDGVMFFISGRVCDEPAFTKMYFGEKTSEIPECNAFIVDGDKIYRSGVTDDGLFWKQELTNNDAFGSGWLFALSAFDFGCNAIEAVKHAITRDSCSGGQVKCYDITSGKFI